MRHVDDAIELVIGQNNKVGYQLAKNQNAIRNALLQVPLKALAVDWPHFYAVNQYRIHKHMFGIMLTHS